MLQLFWLLIVLSKSDKCLSHFRVRGDVNCVLLSGQKSKDIQSWKTKRNWNQRICEFCLFNQNNQSVNRLINELSNSCISKHDNLLGVESQIHKEVLTPVWCGRTGVHHIQHLWHELEQWLRARPVGQHQCWTSLMLLCLDGRKSLQPAFITPEAWRMWINADGLGYDLLNCPHRRAMSGCPFHFGPNPSFIVHIQAWMFLWLF